MNKPAVFLAASLLLAIQFGPPARAGMLNFDFAASNATGPVGPGTIYGDFSVNTNDLNSFGLFDFQSFDFDWNSHHYDASNTHFIGIFLDSAGNIESAIFGNNCVSDFCSQAPGSDQWFAYYLGYSSQFEFLDYSSSTDANNYWSASLSIWRAPPASVPEPGTAWLMALGLTCTVPLAIRKRRH